MKRSGDKAGYRADLQGLRGVAVLLVALGHAGVPGLRGGFVGVDVFFVLSGFLITGLLLARVERDGRVSLGDFYVRRALRILPAAALTLVATTVAAYHVLNVVRAQAVVWDGIWAAVFAANFRFAAVGSDYFAQDAPPSPVQQYWTLAVEEQFYLVWPALLSLVLLGSIGRRRRGELRARAAANRCARVRLLAVSLAVVAASVAWSVHATGAAPASAYYSTAARAWELALGAALALGSATVVRAPAAALLVGGWIGLAATTAAAALYSEKTPYPGSFALVPALGAALVIASGLDRRRPRHGVGTVLSVPPLRYVGDRSYSFYLWHWPVLTLAAQYAGRDLSLGANLLLLAAAFVLSMLTYAFFENPIRHLRPRRPVGVALWPVSAAVVVGVAIFVLGSIDGRVARLEQASAAVRPPALVDPSLAVPVAARGSQPLPAVVAAVRAVERAEPLPSPLTPAVTSLLGDFYSFPGGCTAGKGKTTSKICRLGAAGGAKTMVVFGDSHAQMWMPTVLRLAQLDGWVVVPLVKVGCIPRSWTRQAGCRAWYRWALRQAAALRPEVALIAGSWAGTSSPAPDVTAIGNLGRELNRLAATTVIVGDAPHQRRSPVECLLASDATMKSCATIAPAVALRADDAVAAAARRQRIGFVATRGWFCARASGSGTVVCPQVINRTIAWVDRGHISRTYGLQLAESFRTAFRRELFR